MHNYTPRPRDGPPLNRLRFMLDRQSEEERRSRAREPHFACVSLSSACKGVQAKWGPRVRGDDVLITGNDVPYYCAPVFDCDGSGVPTFQVRDIAWASSICSWLICLATAARWLAALALPLAADRFHSM